MELGIVLHFIFVFIASVIKFLLFGKEIYGECGHLSLALEII